jgi:hypothetical protein
VAASRRPSLLCPPCSGVNNNRTTMTVTPSGGAATTTTYCYDKADRLLATAVTGADAGASPIAAGIPATGLAYDVHGNTSTLVDQTLAYDATDQHVQTTLVDGTVNDCRDGSAGATNRRDGNTVADANRRAADDQSIRTTKSIQQTERDRPAYWGGYGL